jgi:hypothetical protein
VQSIIKGDGGLDGGGMGVDVGGIDWGGILVGWGGILLACDGGSEEVEEESSSKS